MFFVVKDHVGKCWRNVNTPGIFRDVTRSTATTIRALSLEELAREIDVSLCAEGRGFSARSHQDVSCAGISFIAHTDQPSQVSVCKLPFSFPGGAARLIVFR
jgi:hypothetical protein